MKQFILKCINATTCILALTAGTLWAQSLTEAEQAFFQHDLKRAHELYEKIAQASEDPGERTDAELRLATFEWRYYNNIDSARERLLRLSRGETKQAEALIELARMEIHLGNFKSARAAATSAQQTAKTAKDSRESRFHFAWAVVEEALLSQLAVTGEQKQSLEDPQNLTLMKISVEILRGIIQAEPGLLEPSRLLLAGALMLGDGQTALEAWHSYYRVAPGEKAFGLLIEPHGVLEEILPKWGEEKLSDDERDELIRALAASRFFTEAALVALDPKRGIIESAAAQDIVAYAGFIRKVEEITNEYYRRTALGEGDENSYVQDLVVEAIQLLGRLSWPEGEPEVIGEAAQNPDPNNDELGKLIREELGKRFGVTINLGRTAGYLDLHMGHAVIDEERIVEQYGQSATVRFVQLDGVVSNGFQSWAWDFRSQHGGWGRENLIVQIRPAYANGPINAWNRLTDPEERKELEERIARDTAEDENRIKENPYAYLPSLAGRLRLTALNRMLTELRDQGFEDGELRTRFLAEYEHVVQEYSIFAHEGRHAIDKKLGITDSTELEYRAKLSQIAFSDFPKLAICGGILSPDIGSDGSHGQANLRIMIGLVSWMEEHAEEIEELNLSLPLLPQLDLLTKDQLRVAARSMDPLAEE